MITRNTVQRGLVLAAVRALHHPSAEEVYAAISAEHPGVSKATVYRNLNLLADRGEIRRVQALDAAARFDMGMEEHFHAQCQRCGRVVDVFPRQETLNDMDRELSQTGFHVSEREVLYRGICRECAQEAQGKDAVSRAKPLK